MIAVALIVTLLVLVNALYVAAEFATVSARRTRINQMAAAGNRLARQLLPVLRDSQALDRYVATCQVGITATSLLLGAYGQNVLAGQFTPLLAEIGRLAVPAAHSLAVDNSTINPCLCVTIQWFYQYSRKSSRYLVIVESQ